MPKVRDSSGIIGTMWRFKFGSRTSADRMRTNAMVVEILRLPLPSSCGWNSDSGGASNGGLLKVRRAGRNPPNARRRSSRYCVSGESSGGR